MIKKIEEFDRHIAILGFSDVKIKDVDNFLNIIRKKTEDAEIQFFDAKFIAGWEHLYFAVLNALKAFENKSNISNKLAIETLLYSSAQRQIKKAIEIIGIKPNSQSVVAIVIADTNLKVNSIIRTILHFVPGKSDDNVIQLTEEKIANVKDLFGISDIELNTKLERKGMEKKALADLVMEHVALLAIDNH